MPPPLDRYREQVARASEDGLRSFALSALTSQYEALVILAKLHDHPDAETQKIARWASRTVNDIDLAFHEYAEAKQ